MAVLSPALTVNNLEVTSVTPIGAGLFNVTITANPPLGVTLTITATNVPQAAAQQLVNALVSQAALTMTLT